MNQLIKWSFIEPDLWCVFGCIDGHVSWYSSLSEDDYRESTLKMGQDSPSFLPALLA
jgi:hypothetical protein